MAHEGYHEPVDKLSPETLNFHRAVESLIEELEAVDWYNQRANACTDEELKAVLEHNRDEEIEHAAMTLEWIRRRSPAFDKQLRNILFKTGPITGEHE
jgi:ferritin-like protein